MSTNSPSHRQQRYRSPRSAAVFGIRTTAPRGLHGRPITEPGPLNVDYTPPYGIVIGCNNMGTDTPSYCTLRLRNGTNHLAWLRSAAFQSTPPG